MDHNDTISKQIRQAAENAEQAPFPGMDKVWSRVEDKLDHKMLSSQKKYWKKLAVAASVLLVGSVSYQLLKEGPQQRPLPQHNVTVTDTVKTPAAKTRTETAVVEATPQDPATKPNAAAISKVNTGIKTDTLSGIIQSENAVAMEESTKDKEPLNGYLSGPQEKMSKGIATQNNWARSVTSLAEKQEDANTLRKQAVQKPEPLIVLDGDAVTAKSDKEYKRKSKRAMERLREEADSIVVLPDPLYIINGKEYREEELFGPNPTSPYYPLNRQEILSISILKDEETAPYGEKGKKGVVIIITRNGKPVPPEKTKK